jgi:hypothetical protein
MADPDAAVDGRFAGFRVVTEPMPDGRSIHYYEWPADDDSRSAEPASAGSDAPRDAAEAGA